MVDRRVTGLDEGSWWRCSYTDPEGVQCQHVVQDTSKPRAHKEHPQSPMVRYSVSAHSEGD